MTKEDIFNKSISRRIYLHIEYISEGLFQLSTEEMK